MEIAGPGYLVVGRPSTAVSAVNERFSKTSIQLLNLFLPVLWCRFCDPLTQQRLLS